MKELCPLISLMNTYFTWYGLGSLAWLLCSGFHRQVTENTYYIDVAAAAKLLQSRPTLCDPIDGSLPGSPIPGILQARTLEWVAISFSNAWKGKVKVKSLSRIQHFATPWTAAHQAPLSMRFSRQEYWSGWPLSSPKRSVCIYVYIYIYIHIYIYIYIWSEVKWSRSVVSDSLRPHGLQPTRLLRPWDFPGKSTGVGCHCLLLNKFYYSVKPMTKRAKLSRSTYLELWKLTKDL